VTASASGSPTAIAVNGGGEPFPGAQQVVGVQVGQERDVGADVVPAAQRNRTGQAPPACMLDGSVHVP
jgi:hypothetical protein